MSDLVIRPYRPEDIQAVTGIYAHYVRETVITFELDAPDEAEMASRFAAIQEKGHPLLIGEIAMSTMLLVVAALLARSVYELHQEPLGFSPHGLVTFRTPLDTTPGTVSLSVGRSGRLGSRLVDATPSAFAPPLCRPGARPANPSNMMGRRPAITSFSDTAAPVA